MLYTGMVLNFTITNQEPIQKSQHKLLFVISGTLFFFCMAHPPKCNSILPPCGYIKSDILAGKNNLNIVSYFAL